MRFSQTIIYGLVLMLATSFYSESRAQEVKVTNLETLEQRIRNGGDTTYVINFWATWCAPCVAELPFFDQLGKQYVNQPLKVILVSLDFKSKLEKDVIPFVKKHQLKSEVFLNEQNDEKFINKVSKNWSGAIPATLIINSKKSIREFYEQEFTYEELEKRYLEIEKKL